MTYWLYRFRSKHSKTPKHFAKIHLGKNNNFLVLDREASYYEVEHHELEYVGHNMTAEVVTEKIERLDY